MTDEVERPPTEKGSPLWKAEQKMRIWLAIVVVGMVVIVIGVVVLKDDDVPTSRTPTGGDGEQLLTCPDFLEVAGPYRQGIDAEYDPRMDWDGDGVSCES